MRRELALVSLVVGDYDEAIDFFTRVMGFRLVEDIPQPGKRWVVVDPGGGGARLLLARAANPQQEQAIGNQTGGRVGFFLHTDDFQRDYERLLQHGVRFTGSPRHEPYGTVVVFLDLYGNKWDLIEPATFPGPS